MRPPPSLQGVFPALVTPFLLADPGELDLDALSHLAARAVGRGVGGLVACGSTGEAPALSAAEHARVVRCVVEAAAGHPVVAGVGAPCTDVAVNLAAAAERVGATALLVSAPPYVRPTQAGLIAHLRAVAAVTALPIVLYDVPSRAGVAFADETVARLFEDGVIQALKDASGDLARPARLRRLCGDGLIQLSGDDATAAAHLAMGGQGCISVTANVVPRLCVALHDAFGAGDQVGLAVLRDMLAPLDAALFAETNPIPVKAALALRKLCAPALRLPLTRAEPDTVARLGRVMAAVMEHEERVVPFRPRLVA